MGKFTENDEASWLRGILKFEAESLEMDEAEMIFLRKYKIKKEKDFAA